MTAGQKHSYRVRLDAGFYSEVAVEQVGSDVAVWVLAPSGGASYEIDSPSGTQGREVAYLLGGSDGKPIELTVLASLSEPGGHYKVSVDAPRIASAKDQTRVAAEEAFARGETLRRSRDSAALGEAVAHHLRALALLRELNDHPRQADCLDRLGRIQIRLGRYELALGYYLQALALLPAKGRENPRGAILDGIGRAYDGLGDADSAVASYLQALDVYRSLGDASAAGRTLTSLGRAYTNLGRYYKANVAYNEALAKVRGDSDAGNVLYSQALLAMELGKPQTALDKLDRAMMLFRNAADSKRAAVALAARGTALAKLNQPTAGLEALEEALRTMRQLGDRREEAVILNNLAAVQFGLGELGSVRKTYLRALTVTSDLRDGRGEMTASINLGLLELRTGRLAEAESYLRRARPTAEAQGDREAAAAAFKGIAEVERGRGNLMAADHSARQALECIESLREEPASANSRSSFFAANEEYFRFYIDLLMERHRQQPRDGFAAAALEIDERFRARSLLDELARGAVERERSEVPEQHDQKPALWRKLRSATRQRNALAASNAPALEREPFNREIRELVSALEALPVEEPPELLHPLRLRGIQRLLADGDTLLLQYSLGEHRSFLWAVSARGLTVFELPARHKIESLVRLTYELITAPNRALLGSAAQTALRDLSAALLPPLSGELSTYKRLAIVADGALYLVPFAALPRPGSDEECLLDQYEIAVLPSSSSLAALRAKRRAPELALAVVGDPVFDSTDPRLSDRLGQSVSRLRSARPSGLARLPYAAAESRAILAMAPKNSFAAFGFTANRSLLEDNRLSRASILHFATHAVVDAEQPELSGLALSNFDLQGRRRDGFVYAYEIHDWDLAAELVVLSACETALGKEVAGEGAMGLSRAFFVAGSRRVLVTLWPVDDRATAALMKEFYRFFLTDRLPASSALRAAQRAIRAESSWRSPYFWAGFELQGDWR